MDFALTGQQVMIRDTARALFAKEFPASRLREVEGQGLAAFLPLYRTLGDLGFLGLTIPEDAGGAGGTWLDAALFNEEAGRALVPTLHVTSAMLGGHALLALDSSAQRRDLLSRLASGATVIAPAYLEEGDDDPGARPATTATVEGDRVALSGAKRFVEGFEVASTLLVTARGEDGRPRLVLVPRESRGLRHREWALQSLERVADVELAGATVGVDAILTGDWDAWLDALDGARVALAAYAVGAAQAALDLAVAYSTVRIQFDRPIGSFQALQHKLADAAMHVEQARTLVQYVAWHRDAGGPSREDAAMAKLLAGGAVRRAAYTAMLTHGGYGFMEEQDVQLFFRRAKRLEHQLGGAAVQQALIIPPAAEGDGRH